MLLGRSPVFWIQDLAYLGAIAGAALLTYATACYVRIPEKALLVADALGLGLFVVFEQEWAVWTLDMAPQSESLDAEA